MTEKQDFVYYEKGLMLNSSQPMKQIEVCVVSTKNHVFYVPKKTVGNFVIVSTTKIHKYFDGISIEEGVRKIVNNAESVDALEKAMISLLEDDGKYIHKISEKKSFKFKGFLGNHTLRMSTGGTNWSSIFVKGKGKSKEFRMFHGQ